MQKGREQQKASMQEIKHTVPYQNTMEWVINILLVFPFSWALTYKTCKCRP